MCPKEEPLKAKECGSTVGDKNNKMNPFGRSPLFLFCSGVGWAVPRLTSFATYKEGRLGTFGEEVNHIPQSSATQEKRCL